MSFSPGHCPECNSENFKRHTGYTLKNGETREIYYCWDCDSYFSETKNTPLAGFRITSYNVCYTKLLRHRAGCLGAGF